MTNEAAFWNDITERYAQNPLEDRAHPSFSKHQLFAFGGV